MSKFAVMTEKWKSDLSAEASAEKAKVLSRFFKTGKGEYGEGDIFIGVTVPANRKVAHLHADDGMDAIAEMLQSEVHEHRLSALLALCRLYEKGDSAVREAVADFYVRHTAAINNWDLVDLSAPQILGRHALHSPAAKETLEKMSRSIDMWKRRIAIVSTLTLISHHEFAMTLDMAARYLAHPEPLIHKATGWMLREVGKRDPGVLLRFLDTHAPRMPRTALRYAIERLVPEERRKYMAVKQVSRVGAGGSRK